MGKGLEAVFDWVCHVGCPTLIRLYRLYMLYLAPKVVLTWVHVLADKEVRYRAVGTGDEDAVGAELRAWEGDAWSEQQGSRSRSREYGLRARGMRMPLGQSSGPGERKQQREARV